MLHIVDSNTKQFMFAASRILFLFIYHNNFFQSSVYFREQPVAIVLSHLTHITSAETLLTGVICIQQWVLEERERKK